jgi:hypothetical protein
MEEDDPSLWSGLPDGCAAGEPVELLKGIGEQVGVWAEFTQRVVAGDPAGGVASTGGVCASQRRMNSRL